MRALLSVRPATAYDVDALQDLYLYLSSDNERCPPEIAETIIRDITKYAGSAIFIGEFGGEVVCTCTLIVIPNLTRGGTPYALIENVVTHPAHRGKGFGTSMLDAATDEAWQNGCYKIMLSTGSRNPSTLAFYAHAGFEQTRTGFQKRRIAVRVD
jgi:GNAT superfamily N-acetyltransferase